MEGEDGRREARGDASPSLYALPLQSLAWEPVAALYNRVMDGLMHFQVTCGKLLMHCTDCCHFHKISQDLKCHFNYPEKCSLTLCRCILWCWKSSCWSSVVNKHNCQTKCKYKPPTPSPWPAMPHLFEGSVAWALIASWHPSHSSFHMEGERK